jgi:hypothetical protein
MAMAELTNLAAGDFGCRSGWRHSTKGDRGGQKI